MKKILILLFIAVSFLSNTPVKGHEMNDGTISPAYDSGDYVNLNDDAHGILSERVIDAEILKFLPDSYQAEDYEETYTGYNIFIDPSAASGGDGSIETPYDEFADINWTSGGNNSIFDWVTANDEDIHINLKKGETFRQQLQTELSGTAEHNIYIQAYGSEASPPLINVMDVVGTGQPYGWVLDADATKLFTTYRIYRLNSPADYNGQYISSSVANGSVKAKLHFYNPPVASSWSDFKDGWVFLYNGVTYYRRSDLTLTQMNNALFQAGARQMGISGGLPERLDNYYTVDGIDFVGNHSYHSSYLRNHRYDAGGVVAKGQFWTIRNCNFRQLSGCGTSTKGGSTISDWTVEDCMFDFCWQGTYFFRHPSGSCHSGNGNHVVRRCSIYNSGALEEEAGDKCAIQFIGNNNNLIEDCYIENVSWDDQAGHGGPAIIFDTSEGNIVRRTYFKNTGGGCIGGGGASQRLGMEIHNNVFDGWGAQDMSYQSPTLNCAVVLGGGVKTSSGGTYGDNNKYGSVKIYENIFINGGAADPAYYYRNALFIDGYDFTQVLITGNIFAYNTSECEYLLACRPTSPSSNDGTNFQIKNNYFYSSDAKNIINHHSVKFDETGMSGATSFNGFRPGISGNIFGVDPLIDPDPSDYSTWSINPTTIDMVKTGGEKINVYPVPFNDKLTLANVPLRSTISVYTITGVKVLEVQSNENGLMELNTSAFRTGIYLLNVSNGDSLTKTFKIVKK